MPRIALHGGSGLCPRNRAGGSGDLNSLAYRVQGDGCLVDAKGNPKGWMIGNEVYDNGWNLKYRLEKRKLRDLSGA